MKNIIFAIGMLYSLQAFGWVIDAHFEDGSVGQPATGKDGFTGAFSKTVYSTEKSHTGNKSAKATIRQGHDGWGEFGGQFKYPEKLREGDELWFRTWVYFEDGFDLSCGGCSEGAKFMRTHTVSSSGNHEGYHNYQAVVGGMLMSTSVNNHEFYQINHPWPSEDIRNIGEVITMGKWHAYEHYIKFSSESGKGVVRAWQDGKLIFEDKKTATLRSPTSYADFSYLFTYWRKEGPTQTQSAYIDNVILTNERPSNTDAHGNPYIGIGAVQFEKISPPSPPGNIK